MHHTPTVQACVVCSHVLCLLIQEDDELEQRLRDLPSLEDVVTNDELVQKLLEQFNTRVELLREFMTQRGLLISSGIEPIANDVSIEVKAKVGWMALEARSNRTGLMCTCG